MSEMVAERGSIDNIDKDGSSPTAAQPDIDYEEAQTRRLLDALDKDKRQERRIANRATPGTIPQTQPQAGDILQAGAVLQPGVIPEAIVEPPVAQPPKVQPEDFLLVEDRPAAPPERAPARERSPAPGPKPPLDGRALRLVQD